jgi:charged multivesicular body protein 2B
MQVLDSIGVDIAASMQAAPGKRVAAAQASKAGTSAEEELDDDLVNRLAQLKS